MSDRTIPKPDINSWLEDEMYTQFLHDRKGVDEDWKDVFETNGEPAPSNGAANGHPAPAAPAPPAAVAAAPPPPAPAAPSAPAPAAPTLPTAPAVQLGPSEQLVPLKGAAARLAANMSASLSVPTATSQRSMPVKVIEENRRLINQARAIQGKSKISFTHLIGWAIAKGLESMPALNDAYAEQGGEAFRLVRKRVNLGIAIDVAGAGGTRALVVPSIKDAASLDFAQYMDKFDDLVQRGRKGKLTVDDFQGTTISLTNPGTVGTIGSVPRLMPGQGCIIASGAMDFPSEFAGTNPETLAVLGVSKTMMLTCTYDHRVIQGAESGMFLGKLESLLQGGEEFYEGVFTALRIPYRPVHWETDSRASLPAVTAPRQETVAKEAAVLQLINAYRVRGHLVADLNPLGQEPGYHPELDPATYGFSMWDLDREFITGNLGALMGEASLKPVAKLREILDTLRQTYSGKIGCEYMSIQFPEQKTWLQQRMEPQANNWPLAPERKQRILERLLSAERFESFLGSRFVGQKRFSLEGAETAIAILDALLDRAADADAHEVVMGMAHRGRLTILTNIVGKPMSQVFSEFEGHPDPDSTQGSGDVKYHLGATGVHRSSSTGKEVMISMAPNPSHLEAVNPVVEGIVRAKQGRLGDTERRRIIPVLIHGDAAFAGQGVVAETLNLSQLYGYRTGGTIHLVINNQIGFTTNPMESRSSVYCTDIARMVQAPIFHVNGDDPEACVRALEVAFDFRQQFRKDVVIDLICYRRHGHNEGDDPSYTQPIMYRKIDALQPVSELYAQRLMREGLVTAEQVDRWRKKIAQRLDEGFDEAKQFPVKYEVQEMGFNEPDGSAGPAARTAVDRATLDKVIDVLTTMPDGFHLHPKLKDFVEKRKTALDNGTVDWALAEALAFGTLVSEGISVRLSGQDSGRGTFSQRHLALIDTQSGERYRPLKTLAAPPANFGVYDSSLSEFAVMGFEFGYSVGDPRALVLWEAQFGDFVNGAQVMIDQFITVSQQKWGQPSGLVLLLPHGYEGQGPEHSSARIERFLTLCAEDNIYVCNVTTPAQYFHLLRRQMHGSADRRALRKPLVLFTPKSLLRHKRVVSGADDFTSGAFREVIGETSATAADRVSRVIICSGKVYYDLLAAREERRADHVAIIRLEQMYPFPKRELRDHILRYPDSADVVWVQEEPLNMGGWRVLSDFIQPLLESSRRVLRYIGRPESASPAAGSYKTYQKEQADIIEAAFSTDRVSPVKKVRVVKRRAKVEKAPATR